MEYHGWREALTEQFPSRDTATARVMWEGVKSRLNAGQTVSCTVVTKAPFGAWLDIGEGFPALLMLPDIEGLTAERYRTDDWCPLDRTLTATVAGFNDQDCVVVLRQVTLPTAPPSRL